MLRSLTQQNGIIIIDSETHTIVDANTATLHTIVATREDAIGHECHKFICPAERSKCPITDLGLNVDNSEWVLIRTDHTELSILKTVSKLKRGSKNFLIESFIDITERKRAEEQIHRQTKLLAAINRIFYETLTADSEETVANTCLKVAQEITESKFGFIGEITPEGLFTTTALSDPGWEACRIPEKQANVLIKDMVIRGIWGQVLLKEQSLTVNDPASYPDHVGIPEGHPPPHLVFGRSFKGSR